MQQKIWDYLYNKAKIFFDSWDKSSDELSKTLSSIEKYIKNIKFKKDGILITYNVKNGNELETIVRDKEKCEKLLAEINTLAKKCEDSVKKTMTEKDFADFLSKNGIDMQAGKKEANAYIKEVIKENLKDDNDYAKQELRHFDEIIKLMSKANSKKAYTHSNTRADSKEYAEFQAHKIVSAAFDKVFRR